MGKTAVHCLMHRISPNKVPMPRQLSFSPKLIERGSTQRGYGCKDSY
ncbi:hypothetical protein [Halovibrio variabilis]